MNERIREFAIQTDAWCDQNWHNESTYNSAWEEKFAELIIQECVSTLNDMHLWQSVNNQNYPASWYDAVDQGIDAIKEHFGVE